MMILTMMIPMVALVETEEATLPTTKGIQEAVEDEALLSAFKMNCEGSGKGQ